MNKTREEIEQEAERIHDFLFRVATSQEMLTVLKTVYWKGREDGKNAVLKVKV